MIKEPFVRLRQGGSGPPRGEGLAGLSPQVTPRDRLVSCCNRADTETMRDSE